MENSKILAIRKINIPIIVTSILIALALCLINYSNIDFAIQNHLFDFKNKAWLIDHNEPIKKFFFYKLPKILLGFGIFFCLIATVCGFKKKSPFFHKNRHKFFLIFLGLSLIPLIVGNIKKFTNTYCPSQLDIYGGKHSYVRIFDHSKKQNFNISADYLSKNKLQKFQNFYQTKRGKCFPAGHAVTGFSLLILFFAFEKKSHKFLGFFSGIILGWILGFYQMAKGAHFFGDTLVSMLACFLVAAVLSRIYNFYVSQTHPKLVEGCN